MKRAMKKNSTCHFIPEQETVPQDGYTLSKDEYDRLTAYVSLLISIDRKNKAKNKRKDSNE